jgi:Leucine-rich repeat (LRR) protein
MLSFASLLLLLAHSLSSLFLSLLMFTEELWLDQNEGLTGSLPTTIGRLSNTLQSLSLTNTSLTGQLPTQLGQLSLLTRLWLYGNDLSGIIPTELGNILELTELGLHGNRFSGSILPAEICQNRDDREGDLVSLTADCPCNCCTECY